ncbi:MAG: hypothetical protein KKA73_01565 [Chloroflexi bacterium]|nr:hypothetical protein [Chloroflexota bacterium]MBU1746352.1 hypothetical protein [Chloroflexota bacterium]
MCIRLVLAPTDEHIAAAQWDLIGLLERDIYAYWLDEQVGRPLGVLFRQVRDQASTPTHWTGFLAQALLALAQDGQATRAECDRLRDTNVELRRQVYHQIDPLHDQVKALTQERDRWRTRATEAEALVTQARTQMRSLEQVQMAERMDRENRISELEGRIASLNRIIVDLQGQVNARQA